ncbi:putative DNA binding domain-containing protein [Treponema sp. OMZ 789]|nr:MULTISPECIES: RNA-binding domain-containing protein [unclassified Treponema]UTC66592.1 putative DNA binding domain-containing protein [Treponema sp. OMZ 789]UTC69325.1 putative DNA binding domain-containing protein [Treponema sp. OMZ 790]UTC72039.1 putative DNA binding domain-containing protein [Treponema sp. OMZ 791]
MNLEEVNKLLQNGEKIDVEFKESKDALTKDIYDSVCSFNNRNGGHILLGVNDKRKIVGVNPDKVDKIIKEFTTSINNSQKIYPPLYLVPVKKIATQKVAQTVARNVAQTVARNVAQTVARKTAYEKAELIAFIKERIRKNNKITRQAIADAAGVSKKTIERYIKKIDNLKYVGRGSNGHWEINDKNR